MASNSEVADIIEQQLGGNRFYAMTGAVRLTHSHNDVWFSLPRTLTKDRANRLHIVLEGDTYTVSTHTYGRLKLTQRERRIDVYASNLGSVVAAITGLDLRL